MSSPLISCVVTSYNEGKSARASIESLLNQDFDDFEVIVVEDGSDEATREAIGDFKDSRITIVRQSNDGLSSARNRGIGAARGEYVCFLDADDMRPSWAFSQVSQAIESSGPDCIITKGLLAEQRNEVLDFYDVQHFDFILNLIGRSVTKSDSPSFRSCTPALLLIEPQAANKFVRRNFINEKNIRFPNGHFFEDMLFHIGVISNMDSFCILDAPCFTYFRRYGRPQITSGVGASRFDAVAVAFMTFKLFANASRSASLDARCALILSMLKLLQWCETTLTHVHRWHYREAILFMMATVDSRYVSAIRSDRFSEMSSCVQWGHKIMMYARMLIEEVDKRNMRGS